MDQKLIRSFLLGSLSLATLVPTGVVGWKVLAAKGEAKANVEVPEIPRASMAPLVSPVLGQSTNASGDDRAEVPRVVPSVEPTSANMSPFPSSSPSSSSFPVASSMAGGARLGEDDRVEVEGVETHARAKTSTNQSIHLED